MRLFSMVTVEFALFAAFFFGWHDRLDYRAGALNAVREAFRRGRRSALERVAEKMPQPWTPR
jgi:hypothetical protein